MRASGGPGWRGGWRRIEWTAVIVTVVLMATAGTGRAHPPFGTDPTVIHACKDKSGNLSDVGPTGSCAKQETPVHWTIAGPAGQACLTGEFVTGFDAAGRIICRCPLADSQATLAFESQGLDLETGGIVNSDPFPAPVDFHFAFNATRSNPIVLFQEPGAEIAFLNATPFDAVCASVLSSLTFTSSLIDVPFDFDDTVVIKTSAGNFFKVGKPVNNASNSVTFSYAKLQ
jgi:hypothetical protein